MVVFPCIWSNQLTNKLLIKQRIHNETIKLQELYETTVFTFSYRNIACLLCKLHTINAVLIHYRRKEAKPARLALQ